MKKYGDELKEIQKIDLKIAKYFVDFCNKNNLLCYFCGGGCIGAIRHHGFIPWDDDLDFFMPRDSYNKLIRLWKNDENHPFVLRTPNSKYNDHDMFTTIRDIETTMIKEYQKDLDIPHGIAIDIFPLDGCPKSRVKRKIQLIWAYIFQLFCAQLFPQNHGALFRCGAKLLLGIVRGEKSRYKIWKFAEKQMSKYDFHQQAYVTEICAGPRYMKNEYPREIFDKAILREFENTLMPIPVGYDVYLKMVFGEYMQMPPIDKQVSHHTNICIDCNNSYEKYKGKFYLKK